MCHNSKIVGIGDDCFNYMVGMYNYGLYCLVQYISVLHNWLLYIRTFRPHDQDRHDSRMQRSGYIAKSEVLAKPCTLVAIH